MIEQKGNNARRQLLKSATAGTSAVILGNLMPERWMKPIVNAVVLPTHASTTEIDDSLPEELPTVYFGSASGEEALFQVCIECLNDNCDVKVLESYPGDAEGAEAYFYEGSGIPGANIILTQPNSCDDYTVSITINSTLDTADGNLTLLDGDGGSEISEIYSIPQAACGISASDEICTPPPEEGIGETLLKSQTSPIKRH